MAEKSIGDNTAATVEAVQMLSCAVKEDEGHRYEEALRLYDGGIQKLNSLLPLVKTDSLRRSIVNKRQAYQDRADLIRVYLKNSGAQLDKAGYPAIDNNSNNLSEDYDSDDDFCSLFCCSLQIKKKRLIGDKL